MDMKVKRVATAVIFVLTAMVFIGFITVIVLFKTDDLSWDDFIVYSYFLSFTLMTLVVFYGALMLTVRSSEEEYLDYLNRRKSDDGTEEPGSNGDPGSGKPDETHKRG